MGEKKNMMKKRSTKYSPVVAMNTGNNTEHVMRCIPDGTEKHRDTRVKIANEHCSGPPRLAGRPDYGVVSVPISSFRWVQACEILKYR